MSYNDRDLAWVQDRINKTKRGKFCAKEIIGPELWKGVKPNSFGIWFKKQVDNERLVGIAYARRKSNNNHLYEILSDPE